MKTENLTKVIILIITYDCNLRCSYCYEPKKAHHRMSAEKAKEILRNEIDNLDDSYTNVIIQFMGGEPLLSFDLMKDVSEWIWSQDFKVEVRNIHAPTNGTILTEEMKGWLTTNKDRFSLALSFDGDRLMQNINRSDSYKDIDLNFFAKTFPDVAVKMTLSPQTIDYFYEGFRYLHEKGFNEVGPSLAIGDNVGWTQQHLTILSQQLKLIVEYLIENPHIHKVGNFDIPVWDILDKDSIDRSCRVGKDIICYDYNGITYPCHIFSPVTLDIDRAIQSKSIDFKKVRNSTTPCTKCVLKRACTRCYGINYRDRGNCATPSPFDCAQFKLFFFANCRYHILLAQKTKNENLAQLMSNVMKYLSK